MLSHYEPHTIYEEVLNGLQDFLREKGLDVYRAGDHPNYHLKTGTSWILTVQEDGIRIYRYDDIFIIPYEDPQQFEKVLEKLRGFENP